MKLSRLLALLVALAALTAIAGTNAGAQTGPTQPGCAGLSVEDPENDARRLEGGSDAPDNFDITGVFFTYSGGKAFANMRTQAGGDQLPPGASGARWYIVFTAGGKEHFVRAAISNLGDAVFQYGDTAPTETGTSYTVTGETTGKFNEGTPGVLQIAIPPEVGGTSGTELSMPRGETFDVVGNALFPIDAAPDDGGGDAYVVNGCESGANAAPQPQPPGPPAPPAPPSGGGGGGGGAQPAAAPPESTAQPGTLAVKLAKTGVKAKGRSVTFALTGTATGIRATLLAGAPRKPTVVGRGSLARIAKKGKLKLRLSRKLKKGSYLLALTGTNPDGRGATLNVKVRLR